MRDKTKLFGALALAHAHRLRCKSLPPNRTARPSVSSPVSWPSATSPFALRATRRLWSSSYTPSDASTDMRPYITAAATAVGLLAVWVALVPFVA